jgi:DNA-binding XRE family transcriptional regulator
MARAGRPLIEVLLDDLPSEGYNPAPMGRTLPKPDESPGSPIVGDRIRAARERAGLTQSAAAARHSGHVAVQYWSDVERGRRSPSLEWLWEAARAIGCNPHSLDERLASKRWPKA